MNDRLKWREDNPGLFTEQDGAARIAIAVTWDKAGNQHPATDELWAKNMLYALQEAYGSALRVTEINGQDCVVINLPEPA